MMAHVDGFDTPETRAAAQRARNQRDTAAERAKSDAKAESLKAGIEASLKAAQWFRTDAKMKMRTGEQAPTDLTAAYVPAGEWRTPLSGEAEVRMHVYHLVTLARETDPIVEIAWLLPETHATRLLAGSGGVSLRAQSAIAVPAITTIEDVATALHELGHQRTWNVTGRLARELAAWRFAIDRSLIWNGRAHAFLADSILTYVAETQKKRALEDILTVHEIDQLVTWETCRQHIRPGPP